MCLILDCNLIHQVFPSASADFKPVRDAIVSGRAKLVYGGDLTAEYAKVTWFRGILRRLDQQGAAKQYPDSLVVSETAKVQKQGKHRSNDAHILGLAVVSGARLLCSQDHNLGLDFTDPLLLPPPRGSVYKRASHAHLIRRHCTSLDARHGHGRSHS